MVHRSARRVEGNVKNTGGSLRQGDRAARPQPPKTTYGRMAGVERHDPPGEAALKTRRIGKAEREMNESTGLSIHSHQFHAGDDMPLHGGFQFRLVGLIEIQHHVQRI
uniref:Uncharacterized protein n=1 Tax=Candidatus Kentrum sp. TUN TaxID=2126343 RepID=A0A450ZE45_9GAMM|nr:MAG: hypothetical protein BECKTUN1418D_GA0071000_101413 [Candidatus Kentron sp. TUN]